MDNHVLSIEGREHMTVTAVTDVDSFTEEMVLVKLEKGGLIIKGKKLHVQRLDLQEGKVAITGEVESVLYTEKTKKKDKRERKGLLKRLFGQSA
ncbi:MAG: sporulation protein YabP [Clostridiales bacterium]|nr:sporulation protein YabP [Clostridiales bacterium]